MQLFQDQVAELNTACCDRPGACSSGVPDTCDVKCARVFLPFYTSCGKLLHIFYGDDKTVVAFSTLNVACASIPSDDILLSIGSAVCDGMPMDHGSQPSESGGGM